MRCLYLLLAAVPLLAQSSASSLTGRVTDATGAVMVGVSIEARDVDTNQRYTAITNTSGDYTIPYMRASRYTLEARLDGFRSYKQNEFRLAVDQILRLDIAMEIGATTESVTVWATPTALTTESGARGDVTTEKEITDIPLAGRNFSDLAFLTGGVLPKGEDGDGAYAINGARADNVGFVIDGMNNTQRRNTGSIVSPPIEGVQEFKIITSGFAAEYGRFAGGVLSVVMKSGGNKFRGSLYEFIRNDVLDARGFFPVTKNKLRRHQFGATLSGPVIKNKTFFLVSWESLRAITGTSQRGIVPTPEFLKGDFSKAVDANGRPLAIKDILNANRLFPNNQIPADRLDPVALRLAAFYPKPNLLGNANNYIAQGNTTNDSDNFTIKGDHNISAKDRLNLSTFWSPSTSYTPFNRSPIAVFGPSTDNFSLLAGIRYVRVISPNVVNEASISFSRRTLYQGFDESAAGLAQQAGFPGGTTNPIAVGVPQSDVSGYISLGHAYDLPKIWAYNNFQYADSLTWIKGRHTMKFGGEFLRYQYFSRGFGDTRGRMTFLGRFSNEPMADFVLGYAQTTRRQLDAAGPYHLVSNYAAYVQDDFKVTPNLTLNLGIRYELMKPPLEKYGAWSMFVPELGKVVIAGKGTLSDFDARIQETGLSQFVTMADQVGLPKTIVKTDYNNFAPRFGFAYRPFGHKKTVIRGGYGIFYGTGSLYRLDELSDTYPFSVNESYSAVSTNPLMLTVSNPFPAARRRVGGITSTSGQYINSKDQYLQSWNFTMEREFKGGTVIEASYAASKGTHLPRRWDINQPDRRLEVRQADGTFPRPFSAFQTINYFGTSSNSSYNSGVISLRKRFNKELFIRASYTFAKSLDESSNTGGTIAAGFPSAQDARNLKLERGRSDFDTRHSFLASFIYSPRSKQYLFKDWQLAGTMRAYTGAPFTPKVANASLDLGDAVRPDRIANGRLDNAGPDQWFDRSAFPVVPRGSYRYGTSGRNVLDGPGLFNLDASLSRRFRFTDTQAFQFRWETFNVSNRTNFNLPTTQVDVLNGGVISQSRAARVFQLGLRYEF